MRRPKLNITPVERIARVLCPLSRRLGHGWRGTGAMIACCIPMIVLFVYVGLQAT